MARALFCWLSQSPLVLCTQGLDTYDLEALDPQLAELPVTHIYLTDRPLSTAEATVEHRKLAASLPNWTHRIGIGERRLLPLKPDSRFMYFHEQLLVCPERWKHYSGTPKYYNAILQAPATPWARHMLAAKIPNLNVVAHCHVHGNLAELTYADRIKAALPEAYFGVAPGEHIDPHLANWFQCQSKTGLILSENDGGCRVVAEYQLAGLPVISTLHTGGRCELTDPHHMVIVPPNPDVIAESVKMLIARATPGAEIRATFLSKLLSFRKDVETELGCPLLWPQTAVLPRIEIAEAALPS